MQDFTVRRYSFDELEGEARETAIDNMSNNLNEWIDDCEITDYLDMQLSNALGAGKTDLEIMYSLTYCQGDGVALYGRLYAKECPNLTLPDGTHHIELVRNRWAFYSHYNTFSVEAYDVDYEPIDLTDSVIERQLRDLCKDLERAGYKYIESLGSRESAISYLTDNYGDEFTIDGKWDIPKGIIEEVLA